MTDERIDLSSLDPSRDAARWDRLTQSVADRAWKSRQRRITVAHQLLAWARPALAIAATLALIPWIATLVHGQEEETPQQDPALVLARWANADERPSPSRILEVFGEHHGRE